MLLFKRQSSEEFVVDVRDFWVEEIVCEDFHSLRPLTPSVNKGYICSHEIPKFSNGPLGACTFIKTEYIPLTLKDLFLIGLNETEITVIVLLLAKIVKFLETNEVVHCNISEYNVFVDKYSGRVLLSNFDHASGLGVKQSGIVLGTYPPPEVFKGLRSTSDKYKKFDVYAIAAMILTLLGQEPDVHGQFNLECIQCSKLREILKEMLVEDPLLRSNISHVISLSTEALATYIDASNTSISRVKNEILLQNSEVSKLKYYISLSKKMITSIDPFIPH